MNANKPKIRWKWFWLGFGLGVVVTFLMCVIPSIGSSLPTTRTDATRATVQTVWTAIQAYEIKTGKYPESLEEVTQPIGNQPILLPKAALIDAWGRSFVMRMTNDVIEVRSAGPDGKMDTKDDIVSAR